MNSVFDQQGEGWLPGTSQANQALDAAARKMGYPNAAAAQAAGKTLPTNANDVSKFWGQSQAATPQSAPQPSRQTASAPRQNALPPSGSSIPGKPGAVADGKGGWSYPGGPQPSQKMPTSAPASMPQTGAQAATQPTPQSAPQPRTASNSRSMLPKPVSYYSDLFKKAHNHGAGIQEAKKAASELATLTPAQLAQIPELKQLSDLKKQYALNYNPTDPRAEITPNERAEAVKKASPSSIIKDLLNNINKLIWNRNNQNYINSVARSRNSARPPQQPIPRISTPAPKPQSTTQSQDPGFVNLPAPRISSTPAPSSSSGIQFRVIDDILRPIGAPPAANEPEPTNTGMR